MGIRPLRFFAAVIFFISTTSAARAVTILPSYVNGAGYAWTTERQAVIQQALNEWQTALPDAYSINVTFDFTHAGTGSYLGMWEGNYSLSSWTDVYPWTPGVTHAIHFNVDLFSGSNYTWWDPSPTTGNDLPSAGWDALTVARHEVGHMMGFVDQFYYDNFNTPQQFDKWGSHISGTTFDPSGLNVSLAAADDLSHALDSGATASDLMVPALYPGVRQGISATDLNMLHLAYNYTVVPPVTSTTYTLTATAGKTKFHAGGSCTVTATIANTGTGTADTLDFTGLRATTTSSGTISGSSTSGGPLARGVSASNSGLTFTSSTAGTYTITPSKNTATNHALGTAATPSTVTTATVTVYSGQGVWNVAGTGNWLDAGMWTSSGGVPGIDGTLSANDTALFNKTLSSPATVNLNGAAPQLAGLTFNTSNKSFTIASGSGGSLTMNASGGASISVLQKSATISAPLFLGSHTTISGPGVLNLTGGVTGNYVLTVTDTLNARSIRVNTLRIVPHSAADAAVPEPGTFALLGIGAFGLLAFAARRVRASAAHRTGF